jgi:hypothetical protein
MMIVKEPFCISSRLLPALKIGDAFISLEYVGNEESRMVFKYYFDLTNYSHEAADLKSGMGGCTLQEAFGTLLSFLSACGESYSYQQRTGRAGENVDLFPLQVAEWAYQYSDELALLKDEIENSQENLLAESPADA